MTIDTTVLNSMLKVISDGPLMDSVITFSKIVDLFEQNSEILEGPNGRYIETAVLLGYNESVGARSENGAIPIPGAPAVINGRVKLKKVVASAQMTRNIMANAVKGKSAFANWAEVELVKTERALRSELDRMVIGFGAGAVCRIVSVSGSTYTIDRPYGLGSAGALKGWMPGIRRGMRVVFGPQIDGTGLRAGGKSVLVVSVDRLANGGTGTFIGDKAFSDVAANDYIFRGDDYGSNVMDNGVEVEPMGLLGIVDDGTILTVFQNIDRTQYPEWRALVLDGSAAPYSGNATEGLLQRMGMDAMELNDAELTHVVTTMAIWRNIYNQIKSVTAGQGGFGSNQDAAKGIQTSTKGISHWVGDRILEIRAEPKVPLGTIFGLDSSTLRRFHLSDFQWDDTSGSIFKQVMNGQFVKDEFWAYGRTEIEFGCWNPLKNVKVTGLSETAV